MHNWNFQRWRDANFDEWSAITREQIAERISIRMQTITTAPCDLSTLAKLAEAAARVASITHPCTKGSIDDCMMTSINCSAPSLLVVTATRMAWLKP
jgi:hypothetical protein